MSTHSERTGEGYRLRKQMWFGACVSSILIGCSDPTASAVDVSSVSLDHIGRGTVNVAVIFRAPIEANDREFVASVAGRAPDYEFRGLPALLIRVPDVAVGVLRANPRVLHTQVGISGTRFSEIRGWQMDPIPRGMSIKQVHDQTTFGNARFGEGIGIAVLDDLIACFGVSDLFPFNGGSGCAKRVDVTGENDTTTIGHEHGTQVASVIGAGVGNGIGIQGVAPRAQLYSIKVHSAVYPFPTGDCNTWAAGVDYATYVLSTSVSIINMSFGLPANTQAQKDSFTNHCYTFQVAVANAVNSNRLVVAAAGNILNGTDSIAYPARLPGVLAVGGADCPLFSGSSCAFQWGGVKNWSGSAAGSQMGIIAAAKHVRVLWNGDQAAYVPGTSYAAPIVAGIAAQVQSRYNMSHMGTCTIAHLKATAYSESGWSALFYGSGVVNASAAWSTAPPENCVIGEM